HLLLSISCFHNTNHWLCRALTFIKKSFFFSICENYSLLINIYIYIYIYDFINPHWLCVF
ncbi:MAG: hypothetical protein N7Q72_03940, partial [Spiroplasma sp. Tabriz.8]|nr:hypothetical protein [Spiroplasma sp. Tabriz.8]